MASQAQVLQEFLFKLGFKIDEAGAKKFRTGLSDTTKSAMAFGGAVIGMGVALEQFVQKFSEGMEKLYFDSRQMGASAEGLLAFGSAAENVGVSADKAEAMVKSLYLTLTTQAGKAQEIRGLFKGFLGVDLGEMKDPQAYLDKMLNAASAKWKAGNPIQRDIYSKMFKEAGLGDINDIDRMLKFNKEREETEARRKKAFDEGGVNLEKVTDDAHKFMAALRDLGTQFTVLGAQLFELMNGSLRIFIEDITKILTLIGKGDVKGAIHAAVEPGAESAEMKARESGDVLNRAARAMRNLLWGQQPAAAGSAVGTSSGQPLGTPGAEQLHEISHKGGSTGVPLYEGGKRHYSQDDKAAILQDIANSTQDAEELSILAREMSIQHRKLDATAAKMSTTTIGGAKPISRSDYKPGGHGGTQEVTVNNNFHIQGDNAEGIAGAVQSKLDRTNQNLVRFIKNNQTPNQSPVPAPAPGQ